MKKLLFLTIFVLTSLCVSAQNAIIEHVTGTVEIKQPGENSYKIANAGDKLFKETVISTSFKSFVIIKIGNTTITARPLTHLTLTEIENLSDVETLDVNLRAGRVRVDVKPPAGTKAATTVKGPIVTASVRGTSFEFDTNNLYVNEGVVSFNGSRGQNIIVRAGESSRLDQSGTVTIPKDEKISNLMPPNPAGTGAGESAALGFVSAGVGFTIGLEFQKGDRPTN
jgi:hypothetical protein